MHRIIIGSVIVLVAGCGGGGGGGGSAPSVAAPDATAPVIASAVAPSSAFADPTITVGVVASDAVGVTAVEAAVPTKYLAGTSGTAVGSTILALTLSGGTWSRAITFKKNGTSAPIAVPITFTARDAAGNVSAPFPAQTVMLTNLAPASP